MTFKGIELRRVSETTVTVNFPQGYCRPATELEIQLFRELERLSA